MEIQLKPLRVDANLLDLGNKDYQDVVRYAKDIYKKVKNEGVVAAYYVNTYTALLMK